MNTSSLFENYSGSYLIQYATFLKTSFKCMYLQVTPAASSATAPIALHKAIRLNGAEFVVISLSGYDADGNSLTTKITSLPTVGTLFQLSQVYNDHDLEPIYGTEITAVNTVVSGKNNRFIYKRPSASRPDTAGVCIIRRDLDYMDTLLLRHSI